MAAFPHNTNVATCPGALQQMRKGTGQKISFRSRALRRMGRERPRWPEGVSFILFWSLAHGGRRRIRKPNAPFFRFSTTTLPKTTAETLLNECRDYRIS